MKKEQFHIYHNNHMGDKLICVVCGKPFKMKLGKQKSKEIKKYIPKKGEIVRVINGEPGGITGWIGVVKSINNINEIWVNDPLTGAGGLCTEVVPHKKINFDKMRTILLEYKAGELSLIDAMAKLDKFVFEIYD